MSDYKKKSSEYFDSTVDANEIIPEPVLCYGTIIERLSGHGSGRLLDIGCGTGEMLLRIIKEYKGKFDLNGIDLSEKSAASAKKKCGNEASVLNGDAEAMPFKDSSFDILLCMHSFHHYPAPVKALREMARIMKPEGTFYLVENDYPFFRRLTLNIVMKVLDHPNGDIRFYSPAELKKLAAQADLGCVYEEHIADHSRIMEFRKKN